MALFGLMRDKCMYCRKSVEKGHGVTAEVKVPGYVGTFNKMFCSEEHASAYKNELKNAPTKTGGSCCG